MDLSEYLFRKKIKQKDFARLIKYDESYVGQIVNGRRKPGRKFKESVHEATNYEVTFDDEKMIKNEIIDEKS